MYIYIIVYALHIYIDSPWFPFQSAEQMEFLMWHVSGKPLGRSKLDFLLQYEKRNPNTKLPSSTKTLNRLLSKILPILEPTSHKVKVYFPLRFKKKN